DTYLVNPTREGYTFNGWYSDKAGATPITMIDATAYPTATTIYIYGQWVANTYSIEYYDMGGAPFSGENEASLLSTFSYATKYTLTKGTKTGYTFAGWYTDPECTKSIGTTLAASTYAGDVKLYCKWTANSYTITYYRGTSTTKMTGTTYFPDGYPTTHTYDTTTVLPTNVVYNNYYFLGFYTDKAYTNPITEIGPKDITANLALYSKWEAASAHVCTGDITDGTYTLTDRVEPTCHSVGQETYTCYCNNSTGSQEIPYVYVEIPMTDHSYIEHSGQAATCIADGWQAYKTCGNCDYTNFTLIPATGHRYSAEIVDPTCTEGGYTVYSCDNCGDSYTANETVPVGHSYESVTVDATCTIDGYTLYTCTGCGESYTVSVPAEGHNYNAVVTAPTCITEGYTTYTCVNCSECYTENYVASTGHNYEISVTEPTCTEDGYTAYICTACGNSYTEAIAANGHSYEAVITAPTCTEKGYTTYTCTVCGDSYISDETAAAGHQYITSITPPTCTEGGKITYTCKVCGFEVNMPTASKGHSYESSVVLPTCDSIGYTEYTCTSCGDSYTTDEIAAFGHNFTSEVVTESTCVVKGEMLYTCSRCDDTYTEAIDYADHTYSAEITAPTCTDTGYTTYTCTVCSDSYTADETAANGHSFGEWIETEAPTYDETGLAERTCTICSATETKELPVKELIVGVPNVTNVYNYTVTIDDMIGVKEVKFAIGHYTTGSEVKAAEGVLTLSEALVNKNTDANGVFRYEVAKAGGYTFWVRMLDGGEYFLYADITDINTYLTAYGVILTVNDFKDGNKDLWIAEGSFESYAEIKASTAFKYQATSAKLDTLFATHDFTYTVTNPGEYTVLIRYNDGSYDVIHHELTVDYPEFAENGLQVTVSNIPDIKIIRTAYGHYTSVADIKKAAGVRNFSNKNDIKNAAEYMIQYREEGEVTLVVEYNNGYKHFYYYN
ncbi:MAG: InlB B-repeat-containing protein, partial [Clostridia bacterium]|nr:InlB B-repeat-containing protein [Clostridia bacterium]